MFISNLRLRSKILVLAALSALGVASFWGIAHRTLEEIKVGGPEYGRIALAKDLIADVLPPPQYIIEAYLVALELRDETEPARIESKIAQFGRLRSNYDARHEYWSEVLEPGPMKQLLTMSSHRPAREFFERMDTGFIPEIRAGDREAAIAMIPELEQLYADHLVHILAVVDLASELATEVEGDAADVVSARSLLLSSIGAGLVLTCGMLSFLIGRNIADRVTHAAQIMDLVAQGDLTARIEVGSTDEIGDLGRAMNQAVSTMATALGRISSQVDTLYGASNQLYKLSQQMSGSAEETAVQAANVAETSTHVGENVRTVSLACEELNLSIREIARNAAAVAKVAHHAVSMAEAANSTMSRLGESSNEIGKVSKVIDDIAQQTNMLALNATIEAARAGEAGRGFSVVAYEVKELAEETAASTDEITRRVEAIQADGRSAVEVIGQIRTIINQVSEIQQSIAAAVEQQTSVTASIGENVGSGAEGATSIADNIAGVAKAAQITSAGAGDASRAAEELAVMAGEIREIMSQFRR